MSERLNIVTPVGRFVSGDLQNKRSKDNKNRPIPEDKQRFEFGVAFPKADLWSLLTEQMYPWIAARATTDRNAAQRLQNWFQTFSGFSMKVQDGDKPNEKGQVNENTAGHFVMYFSSSFPPNTVDPSNNDIDPSLIKRGYYVQIAGTVAPNGTQGAVFQTGEDAGIFLSGNFVRLIAEGDEIRTGMSAEDAFGGASAPTALPPGARPLGTTSGAAGAFGGAGNPPSLPGAPVPAQTGHAAPPPALPGGPVLPGTAFPGNAAPPYHGIMQPQQAAAAGAPGAFTPPPLPGQG